MQKAAQAVIIGGGIIGCALAYELARRGMKEILVVEKNYLCSGATGRCGAGIRQQWGTELNATLSRDSVKRFEQMNEELAYDQDIEFKQGGYLMCAYTESVWTQFEKNVELQQRLGIPVQKVTPEEAKEIVPHLNIEGLIGATFCGTDGHANPFHVVDAYYKAAKRLGVVFETYTEVTGIKAAKGRVNAVQTTKGDIVTPLVINATSGAAGLICNMVGFDLPLYAQRHQALVTEPVEHMQDPMVMSLSHRLYCQQVPHGSFVMGVGDPNEPIGQNINSSWEFLEDMARQVTTVLPILKNLRVVRQWGGLYDMSPDANPILDQVPDAQGMWVLAGFSGHGFMVAPQTAVLVAQKITGGECFMPIEKFGLDRFRRGELLIEPAVC
ncbi:NAD(P)/FAD-dependent oxidoreductase [Dehalobacterium formicoaceticum]|uniref:FAD-binding oxidoreductase n=1 Tax=Dehalobacterium formicoaceticum TaxID=51515 RepID=A0ABT1Y206_9FIRM|nr:FAD-binding oxidoreductase [Dehalobacterium formicoaceticum]MCR6544516.1 FAD-binding oxidoreductase [Dehalobacterium formicoaceticum]